jgi:uncharacterized membrane protein YfcA
VRELSYQLSFKRWTELCSRWTRVLREPLRPRRLWLFIICILIGAPLSARLQQHMIAAGFDPFPFVLLIILLALAYIAVFFIRKRCRAALMDWLDGKSSA